MALYWNDRQYVSQYAVDVMGLKILQNQVPIDADNGVMLTMVSENTGNEVFSRLATHNATGDSSSAFNSGQGGALFPTAQWGPLLGTLTWIETLKHLIRSYTEQPNFIGSGNISRLDRRDYVQRWRDVLMDEEKAAQAQLDVFKISQMGLGRPAVLISGGVYGRYGPTRMAGSVAARPRYWTRFY
jgi:hypothetical protein